MKCSRCQHTNLSKARFCMACGAGLGARTKSQKARAVPSGRKVPKSEGARVRDLEKRLAEALKREAEALDQQAATSEILQIISRSPRDTQPVLDAIAASAARVCGAMDAIIMRVEGPDIRRVAHAGPIPLILPEVRRVTDGTTAGRAILERRAIHVDDVLAADFAHDYPEAATAYAGARWRTTLSVPLLGESVAIGAITIRRAEVRPFTEKQIKLLETFANQAVIAIENVRLFNETKEALEAQTATSEILGVISQSPTDVQPVLDAVAANAARLCGADDAVIRRIEGDTLRLVALFGRSISAPDPIRPISRDYPAGLSVIERRTIHIDDIQSRLETEFPRVVRGLGLRTVLATPLLREGVPIGAIVIRRTEVLPFSEKQIQLLQTFADQAVIAIENVRLFKELEARNHDLSTALDRQTATSEILGVISRSPTAVQPVFDAIVTSAKRLCRGTGATLFQFDGTLLHVVALDYDSPAHFEWFQQAFPMRLDTTSTVVVRAIAERRLIHITDIEAEPDVPALSRDSARRFGYRSLLIVPMLRDGAPVGAIGVNRAEARAFSNSEITLLKTFADQAVIAIENVRLFKELEARNRDLTVALDQQTATSEILKVISSSPTDVQPVFDTIARNASRLCGGMWTVVTRYDGELLHLVADVNPRVDPAEHQRHFPLPASRRILSARPILDRTIIHIPDVTKDPDLNQEAMATFGIKATLGVPMMHGDRATGSIGISKDVATPFTGAQVELLKTFADQAVIAIENVRLFKELEQKTRELQAASQHKSEFLANMSHELRTPLNAVIGFSEVLSARMFGDLNEKQDEYLKDIHASGQHLLSLINDILDLSKIEAGRMELELSDFNLPATLENALTLIRERAGRRGVALNLTVDERLDQIRADERKVRQVVLNLLSNAIKFTPEGGRIEVRAVPGGGAVEVSVSDTGVGIAPEDQEAIFEEFKQVGTSDKKVEGTGLGLALSRKFIELHGGRIWVKSQVGQGSTFTFTIPTRRGD